MKTRARVSFALFCAAEKLDLIDSGTLIPDGADMFVDCLEQARGHWASIEYPRCIQCYGRREAYRVLRSPGSSIWSGTESDVEVKVGQLQP
jgi:hypothetical protein